jgi:signal peptidase II
MPRYLWISLTVILLDQASKHYANAVLAYRQPVPVIPGLFEWYLSYNSGAAFSFLAGAGGWQRWFLLALALVISAFLVNWMRKLGEDERLTAIGLALILGGALGNVIDRALLGHVIDFIQVWLGSYPWPAFNLADSFITLGAILLIASGLFAGRQNGKKA